MALLEVDELRTYFDTDQGVARSVDGVSFRVDEGEAVGIVGESGCGKTVTSLSIMGLLPQPPGRVLPGSSIRFEGKELVGAPARTLRAVRGRKIAMIFQEPMTSLNPVYSVGDQIAEAVRLHRGVSGPRSREAAVELLREVGIADPARRARDYPHRLSGGMRQRVMIAVALAGDPRLLIADEPTTALDVTVQAQILDLMGRIQREHAMGLLLITHDLGVVAEICDRVIVMYAGQVVEEGGVDRVFGDPAHPYTRGLLGSMPRVDAAGDRLRPIAGSVPTPTDWPPACRFHQRCPQAWDRCRSESPPLLEALDTATHTSRCWMAAEVGMAQGEAES
jgi:peptide/nickel transport system ATP-binding protein/oligopeptide transport system ATP-binding protein